jgi:hypothetical protein
MTITAALFDNRVAQKHLEGLANEVTIGLYRKGLTVTAFKFRGDADDLDYLSATVEMVGHHTKQTDTMLLSEVLMDLGMSEKLPEAQYAALTMVNGTTESTGAYDIIIKVQDRAKKGK